MDCKQYCRGGCRARISYDRPGRLNIFPAVALLALCWVGTCFGSIGDRDPLFKGCVRRCITDSTGCVSLHDSQTAPDCSAACAGQKKHPAPMALKLLGWSCRDDCRYRCMHIREARRLNDHITARSSGAATVKYYGKWPFKRVMGMQEIMSVLFSLMNLLAQAHCLLRFVTLLFRLSDIQSAAAEHTGASAGTPAANRAAVWEHQSGSRPRYTEGASRPAIGAGRAEVSGSPQTPTLLTSHSPKAATLPVGKLTPRLKVATTLYPWWPLWVAYYVTSLLAWTASALFHMRDVPTTEVADYMLADAFILWGCLTSIARATGLQKSRQWVLLFLVGATAYTWHWYRMLTQLFDYGFNVLLCIVVGAVQSMMWGVWVGRIQHPGRCRMWVFLALLNTATALEILDFAPWGRLVDAHALWHAATVPLSYIFFGFLQQDVLFYARRYKAAAMP